MYNIQLYNAKGTCTIVISLVKVVKKVGSRGYKHPIRQYSTNFTLYDMIFCHISFIQNKHISFVSLSLDTRQNLPNLMYGPYRDCKQGTMSNKGLKWSMYNVRAVHTRVCRA